MKKYETTINEYFTDDGWNPDCDIDRMFDFFYDANDIYVSSEKLIENLASLLEDVKFEMEKTKKQYIGFRDEAIAIKQDIMNKFNDCLQFIDYFTEREEEMMNSYQIYRERDY